MTLTVPKIIQEAIDVLNQNAQPLHGCYETMENETYHAIKTHISRSSIMDYDKSPYTYWAKHLNPDRPKKDSTAAMQLGSAFHTMILEPDLFEHYYAVEPTIEPLPKVGLLRDLGKEAYTLQKQIREKQAALNQEILGEFELTSVGKIILTAAEYENLCAMSAKIHKNEQAMQLVEGARIEHSFFWQDAHSGLLLKARPDILHENMIVDLKTTSDASPRAFQNEMVKYGYHVQFAMIRDAVEAIEGRRISNFINIVIETKYPYNMAIYVIDEFAVDEGQVKYKNICLDMKRSLEENTFNDYGIQTIGLPKWASN